MRVAFRSLRKSPVFTTVAILSLALAVGANSAIFSLIDAVLLRPLAGIARSDRLVSLYPQNTRDRQNLRGSSYPDYEYYRDHNHVFSGVMAYLRLPFAVRTGDRTETISGELVSNNFFNVLGASAQIGRTFSSNDPGFEVVLGDRLWRDRFQGAPAAIGKTVVIGEHAFTIIGVASAAFRGVVLDWGERPELWIPITAYREAAPYMKSLDLLHVWNAPMLMVNGRLKDRFTMEQADAEVEVLSRRIDADYPARAREGQAAGQVWNMRTFALSHARFFPGYRNQIVGILAVLIAVAGGVLLIACTNIASLMLIRATERQKEMALRLALGAKTLRVARLLLAESLTIAFAGGIAGLLVAAACTRALVNFPRLSVIRLTSLDLQLDVRVFAFAILITTLSGIAFGLAPLRQAVRTDLISSLKTGAAASTRRGAGLALRNTLLIAQIALTLVLLAGSGLFIRTFQNAADSDPFLQAGNLLLLDIDTNIQLMEPDRSISFFSELLDRTRALPGVRSAGLAWELPLNGIRSETEIMTPLKTTVDFNIVSPEYFEAVGSRVVQGRDFSRADRQSAPDVGIVNEEMAKQLWNGDALGRQITRRNKPVTIVGIVRDGSRRNYRRPVQPCLYVPFAQEYRGALNLVIRTQGDPLSVLPTIRDTVASLSSAAVIGHPQTLSMYSNVVLGQERFAAWCLSAFAALALVLSVVGLYGSTAFSVSQRTPEIGVRVALGARRGQVLRMVLTGAARIAGAGVVAGFLLSFVLSRYAEALLYGVTGADPKTWIVVAVVLSAAVLAASIVPAWRASRIDPATALRSE